MRRIHALTALSALTLGLTACGNGDDGATAKSSVERPSASSTTAMTAAPSSPSPSSSASASSSGSSSASGTASSAAPSSGATSGSAAAPATSAASASVDAAPSSSAQGSGQGGATATASASSGDKNGVATAYAYVATGWSQFTTPSGRNWCNVVEGAVGCQIPRDVSAQHHGANFVTITSQGVGFLTGDPGFDTDGTASRWTTSAPGAPKATKNGTTAVLGYGSTLRAGDTTCKSTVNGVTCSNSVASFTVNSSGVTMTGARTADR